MAFRAAEAEWDGSSKQKRNVDLGSKMWRDICLADDSWTFRFGVHDDEPVLSAPGPVPAVTPGVCEVRFDAVRAVDEDGR